MRNRFRNGVLLVAVLAAFGPVIHAALPASAATSTTVVLTFDDAWANQSAAVTALDAHSMKATFYVNSGVIDNDPLGRLTYAQLTAMQTEGHEIGGTLDPATVTDINTLSQPAAAAASPAISTHQAGRSP